LLGPVKSEKSLRKGKGVGGILRVKKVMRMVDGGGSRKKREKKQWGKKDTVSSFWKLTRGNGRKGKGRFWGSKVPTSETKYSKKEGGIDFPPRVRRRGGKEVRKRPKRCWEATSGGERKIPGGSGWGKEGPMCRNHKKKEN